MPSLGWKLARAVSAISRADAAAAARPHGGGAVKRPPSRRDIVGDAPSAAPPFGLDKNYEQPYSPFIPFEPDGRIFPISFDSMRPNGCLFNSDIRSDKEGMPFDEKDIESEQNLWALYHRWCSYFNVKRCSVKKGYRFHIFKKKVSVIYEVQKSAVPPMKLELNHLCDVAFVELCPPSPRLRDLLGDAPSAAPPLDLDVNGETKPHQRFEQKCPDGRVFPHSFNSMRPSGYIFNADIRSDKEGMPFDEKDLESKQTLWALYDRWCSYFNVKRCNVEKCYRFQIFKDKVPLIYELKKSADPPKKLELNHLCDVSIDELCPPKSYRHYV